MTINAQYVHECKLRKLHAERALAIVTTAAQPPNAKFMDALEQYIAGGLTLEELEQNVDQLKYLELN